MIWMFVAIFATMIACIVSGAGIFVNVLSMVGILFVLGVAQKAPTSQLFGAAFCLLLGIASFTTGFYANAIVNCIVMMPMCIMGYYTWRKGRQHSNLEKNLSRKKLLLYIASIFVATLCVAAFTVTGGGALPILDALTAVLPVAATILMTGGYREQWLIWIPFNALQAFMWFSAASLQPAVLAVFVLKLIFLANSLIGYYNWRKG